MSGRHLGIQLHFNYDKMWKALRIQLNQVKHISIEKFDRYEIEGMTL